jgi:hypothetical protein
MRDNDMAYGFNKAVLDDDSTFRSLWQTTKSFINTHQDMLDSDTDYTWLLDWVEGWMEGSGSVKSHPHDDLDELSEDISPTTDNISRNIIIFDGEAARLSAANPACDPNTVADAFTTRMSGVYNKCKVYPNFEIGSLSFFRSPQHVAYFDHLDSTGDLYYHHLGDIPMHTLSASMFLPHQSVWMFRNAIAECETGITSASYSNIHCPPFPHQTPNPESSQLLLDSRYYYTADSLGSSSGWLLGVRAAAAVAAAHHRNGVVAGGNNKADRQLSSGADEVAAVAAASSWWHAVWELLERDLTRQDRLPALLSGNTRSDEQGRELRAGTVALLWRQVRYYWRFWDLICG